MLGKKIEVSRQVFVLTTKYRIMLNKICHLCFTPFYQRESFNKFKQCSCGVRRMNKEIISLTDLLSSSGKYLDRMNDPSCTQEIKDNGVMLINKVNQLLEELGIEKVTISSGFRTAEANGTTSNAAKNSYHMQGRACDILDDHNQTLAKKVLGRPDLLKKYSLWMEDLQFTVGKNTNWLHLDNGDRTDRPLRMFKP